MSTERNMASLAKIEVQQKFCNDCSVCIKKKLQEIKNIDNVRLYPKKSLITFNFTEVNKFSTALNILSEIGYPEKGEQIKKELLSKSVCGC